MKQLYIYSIKFAHAWDAVCGCIIIAEDMETARNLSREYNQHCEFQSVKNIGEYNGTQYGVVETFDSY